MSDLSTDQVDIGFDIERTKTALVAWLVQDGIPEEEIRDVVIARRKTRVNYPELDECIALLMMRAHNERHGINAEAPGSAGKQERPPCPERRCKTFAASRALSELQEYEHECDGPRAHLAQELGLLVGQLKGLRLRELVNSIDAMQSRHQRVLDAIDKHPESPAALLGSTPEALLLPAVARLSLRVRELVEGMAGMEEGQRVAAALNEYPDLSALVLGSTPAEGPLSAFIAARDALRTDKSLATISIEDIQFPFVQLPKLSALIETLFNAGELAMALLPELLAGLPPQTATFNQGGRPKSYLLNRLCVGLKDGGFSIPEIARFTASRPIQTSSQAEAAEKKVERAIRSAHQKKRSARPRTPVSEES